MPISVFDLFSVGIGPSSSHTVGPMRAAADVADGLTSADLLGAVDTVDLHLYGSLAATGDGHGTLSAILLGLEGYHPESIDTETKDTRIEHMRATGTVDIAGKITIGLRESDLVLHPETFLDRHANGMTITVRAADGDVLFDRTYFSVGGGFVVTEEGEPVGTGPAPSTPLAFPYRSGAELLEICSREGLSISDLALRNEAGHGSDDEIRAGILHLRDVMAACAQSGIGRDGVLPGSLGVRRRAKGWLERLDAEDPDRSAEFAEDWVNLIALAVNEENASGGRVVTAPTNGAAGIIPAVLHYAASYTRPGRADPDGTAVRFLLTAAAIGSLFKERASISGAEVGCQGEVGSAAAMAAAGLAEVLGGSPAQVENAAEIAMEHSLGLTCDPIGGLVQIPCIERNAISAGKAINAARMAMRGDGTHRVSLDQVIDTMRETGRDMHTKYKETATGGLALYVPLNIVEC